MEYKFSIKYKGITKYGKIIIEDIKKYLQEHPCASKEEVARETKHGINTVRRYFDVAHGKADVEQFKSGKNKITKTKLTEELENPTARELRNNEAAIFSLIEEAVDEILPKKLENLLTKNMQTLACLK